MGGDWVEKAKGGESAQPVKSAEMDDRQAMDILQNMARTLAEGKQFSVTLRSSYDALQENRQMIEFGAVRKIQVKRPDNLRVDLEQSDGDQRMLVFDGKQIFVHSITENLYAKAEKVGSVDDAVNYLVGALKIQLPLARMFGTNFSAELEQLVEKIDYVELNMLTYAPCSTTVVVGGSTYYHCDSTWYSRGYEGGDVVYIVTSAPAGY